jgi:hypothetical protein
MSFFSIFFASLFFFFFRKRAFPSSFHSVVDDFFVVNIWLFFFDSSNNIVKYTGNLFRGISVSVTIIGDDKFHIEWKISILVIRQYSIISVLFGFDSFFKRSRDGFGAINDLPKWRAKSTNRLSLYRLSNSFIRFRLSVELKLRIFKVVHILWLNF